MVVFLAGNAKVKQKSHFRGLRKFAPETADSLLPVTGPVINEFPLFCPREQHVELPGRRLQA